MASNILTTLRAEHDTLRDLFGQINKTADREQQVRGDLLEQIENLLIPHAKWEEAEFYPAFAERADRDGLKTHAEAVLEHGIVEDMVIPSVQEAGADTPEFAGRVKVFGELIDSHAKEEETTMFRMARELFTATELSAMDENYASWKDSPAASTALLSAKTKAGVKATVGKMLGH